MPTPELETLPTALPIDPRIPLTPPPERRGLGVEDEDGGRDGEAQEVQAAECRLVVEDGIVHEAQADNTAAGMSLAQEHSMYQHQHYHQEEILDHEIKELIPQTPRENEGDKAIHSQDYVPRFSQASTIATHANGSAHVDSPELQTAMPTPTSTVANGADSMGNDGGVDDSARVRSFEDKVSDPVEDHPMSPESIHHEDFATMAPQISSCTSTSSSPASSTIQWDFTSIRLIPSYPSAFLRPGTHFTGTQQSDRQIYNVDVDILTLSIPQSTLTGYLCIRGLTEDHPTLTTFFTGEIIGGPQPKYTFQTKHPGWGATDKTDLQHWARFPAWRPLSKDAKRDINFTYPPPATGLGSGGAGSPAAENNREDGVGSGQGWWQRETIFMRWKEWFLVPDHRVKSIQGASFEGFYYICFNQVEGRVSGIYFHARSEKYQQLELTHVPDKGVCGAMEFR